MELKYKFKYQNLYLDIEDGDVIEEEEEEVLGALLEQLMDCLGESKEDLNAIVILLKDEDSEQLSRFKNLLFNALFEVKLAIPSLEKAVFVFAKDFKSKSKKGIRSLLNNYVANIDIFEKYSQKLPSLNSFSPFFISAQTGTGKSYLVKMWAKRQGKEVFIHNALEVPSDLFSAYMNGYKKGSFTGAIKDFSGWIKEAEDQVLFIDELEGLSIDAQISLLNSFESSWDYVIRKEMGATRPEEVKCLICFASNMDLSEAIRTNKLRKDFLFRVGEIVKLNTFSDTIKENPVNIEKYISFFVSKHSRNEDKAIALLKNLPELITLIESRNYPWVGNIREFENFCSFLAKRYSSIDGYKDPADSWFGNRDFFDTPSKDINPELNDATADIKFPSSKQMNKIDKNIRDKYADMLKTAYEDSDKNITKTSEALGINFRTCQAKLKEFNII